MSVGRYFKIPDCNDRVEVTFHRPRAVRSVDVRSSSGFDYIIAAIPKGFNSLLSQEKQFKLQYNINVSLAERHIVVRGCSIRPSQEWHVGKGWQNCGKSRPSAGASHQASKLPPLQCSGGACEAYSLALITVGVKVVSHLRRSSWVTLLLAPDR